MVIVDDLAHRAEVLRWAAATVGLRDSMVVATLLVLTLRAATVITSLVRAVRLAIAGRWRQAPVRLDLQSRIWAFSSGIPQAQ